MAKKKAADNNTLLEIMENIFILQAYQAGMKVETIRGILKIDMKRVNAVTKNLTKKK
jgi:hypothetical protein